MLRNVRVRPGRLPRLPVALAMLVLVAGCLAATAVARPDRAEAKKPLRLGAGSALVTTLDPAQIQATDGTFLSIAYAPLIHNNADGSFSPGLATKWRYLNHGHKVFEMTLRQNARFSDGTQVTAPAVVAWLKYYLDAKNFASSLLGPNPKFKATGKWTVRITMTVPNPTVPLILSEENANWGFVASPKAVAKPALFKSGSYGAGPYKLDYAKSVPGDHYTYVPNPYFYDKSAIKFSQIYVKTVDTAASMLQALQAGQLDVVIGLDGTTAPTAEKAGFQVVSAPNAVFFSQLNPKGHSKALGDVRVRQALNYAVDRKAIASALYGKYGKPSSQFTITPDANPGLENYYDYDPAKAKALLKAAGYPNGFTFTLDTITPTWDREAGLVAHYLEAVGVKVKINGFTTGGAYVDAITKFADDGWFLGADVGVPTPIEYAGFIGKDSTFRGGNAVDPQVDRLYYAGLNSKTPAKYWKQMWAKITKDAWFLPLAASNNFVVAKKSVGGIKMSAKRPYSFPSEWFYK